MYCKSINKEKWPRKGNEVFGSEFLEVGGADKAEARLNFQWGRHLVIATLFQHRHLIPFIHVYEKPEAQNNLLPTPSIR